MDQFLSEALPELSRSRAAALIDDGRVQLEAQRARPALRLKGGERVSVEIPPPRPTELVPQELPLSVLYEDASLVVLDKAAGVVVHPGLGNPDQTLVNALLFRLTDLKGVGGALRPGLVHRLDKDTSGCLVVAKTEEALRALQEGFKSRAVEKVYLALVHGVPKQEHARIETPYGRHPVHRKRFSGKVKVGKPAVTEYRVKEKFDGASLLEVILHTGRTHQIRAHLSEAGHPLLGDALYGGNKGKGKIAEATASIGRQALHAWKLAFPHPKTGEQMRFEAALPQDFQGALARLLATCAK